MHTAAKQNKTTHVLILHYTLTQMSFISLQGTLTKQDVSIVAGGSGVGRLMTFRGGSMYPGSRTVSTSATLRREYATARWEHIEEMYLNVTKN